MTLEFLDPDGLPRPESYTQVVVVTGSRLVFVAGHRPEYLPIISEARIAVFGEHKPADALLGVETLAEPGYLIEVEAVAVVD